MILNPAVGQGASMFFLGLQGKAQRRGMAIPFQGVATQSCAAKKHNLPWSELTKKVKVKCLKKLCRSGWY
jgi:hypothetical protein